MSIARKEKKIKKIGIVEKITRLIEENKKNLEEKKMVKAVKEHQAVQNYNGTIIGATTHSFIFSKSMPGIQIEVVDLGEKFGKRLMKWGNGLDCTKIYNGNKEVARIMWNKDSSSPKIRIMGEEGTRYYMLSYSQDSFIYFEDKKKVTVMDTKLANALWFFYRNFVMKLAELKGWKLPEKRQSYYNDKGYWEALEREHEAEEAARTKKNNKA